jgi:hypothetical protein
MEFTSFLGLLSAEVMREVPARQCVAHRSDRCRVVLVKQGARLEEDDLAEAHAFCLADEERV